MNLYKQLSEAVINGFQELFDTTIQEGQIQLQKTKKEFDGQITLVVFPFLKLTKKSPEQSGELIGEYLKEKTQLVDDYNVVKGFLNLSIASTAWLELFNNILATEQYGLAEKPSGKTYMVEYSSPNTNKPLHLGHLRNIFLGYAVAEILKANGHKVVKTQIINDRGIHICKSMLAWQKYGDGETPESSGMKGDHLIGKYYVKFDQEYKTQIKDLVSKGKSREEAEKEAPILMEAREMLRKWEAKDPEIYELWETMNAWVYDGFNTTYKTMGVDFDTLYYESDTYVLGKDIVEDGLSKGLFYKKEDGSVWCDLSAEKMDDKLLLRGDGTSVYMTQDIGTAIERYKDYPDLSGMIYTVGNEQNHHFKVLFAILKKLGYEWANECYHLSYGMVELPEGKMKSREGTVVDADDLMASVIGDAREMTEERGHIEGMTDEEKEALYATIGLGGLKYYLLKVDPKSKMLFDPKESIDLNGNTGPFIQYAYARIQSILRNSNGLENAISTELKLAEIEIELLQHLADFSEVLIKAGKEYSPALLANYIYDLVKLYNSFYQSISILKEENEALRLFRIQLSKKVGEVIARGMKLIGVNVPDRM
ncbi:arginine--tRNA ligase [Parvicella tangerina]|uniref:Arginine--tRNA ligase n=1 Tax=Parvicella tangerina TaxID=2829795 RepID=A0A916NA60_9FLAO|nr:arginine--tRNA ligase [Parvicella tangerina]CAG5080195.1 Arginine--tRNA ligase [Parvicella tangerina]